MIPSRCTPWRKVLKKFAGPPEAPLRARVIRRFGILQGQKEKLLPDGTKTLVDKVLCIDDCKDSKHNFCQRTCETINTCVYDYISHVTREIHTQCSTHNFSLPLGLQFGTDDIKSAYRQVPSVSPEHTTVGFWCFDQWSQLGRPLLHSLWSKFWTPICSSSLQQSSRAHMLWCSCNFCCTLRTLLWWLQHTLLLSAI